MTLSTTHRKNFAKLAQELLKYEGKFCMDTYFGEPSVNYKYLIMEGKRYYMADSLPTVKELVHCGTSCCAAGLAAITPGLNVNQGETPSQHLRRVFGAETDFDLSNREAVLIWHFAFASHWPDDNVKAAQRCEYLAEHGIYPEGWDDITDSELYEDDEIENYLDWSWTPS